MPYWERLESLSWIERRRPSLGVAIDFSSLSEEELSELESSLSEGCSRTGAGFAGSLWSAEELEEEDDGGDLPSSGQSAAWTGEELEELECVSGTSSIGEINYFVWGWRWRWIELAWAWAWAGGDGDGVESYCVGKRRVEVEG